MKLKFPEVIPFLPSGKRPGQGKKKGIFYKVLTRVLHEDDKTGSVQEIENSNAVVKKT